MWASLIGLLTSMFFKELTLEVLKATLWRGLILSLFVFVLPVVLYNVFFEILGLILGYINSHLSSSGLSAAVISVTGLGAWLVTQMRLPECFSVLLSACGLRFTISMIRGV